MSMKIDKGILTITMDLNGAKWEKADSGKSVKATVTEQAEFHHAGFKYKLLGNKLYRWDDPDYAKSGPVKVTKADERIAELESKLDTLANAMSQLVAMQMAAAQTESKAKAQRTRQ